MRLVRSITHLGLGMTLLAAPACDSATDDLGEPESDSLEFRSKKNKPPKFNVGSYNFHLSPLNVFELTQPGTDADLGRARFGVAADLVTEDITDALFEGDSLTFGGTVTSNGRTCFTCHRGADADFGLPPLPLSSTIPLTDSLFTGLDADAQGDVDGMTNLDQHGLFKIRPNRFNPTRGEDDPFKQVFGWRKSPALTNIGLSHGLLTDLRGRTIFETARGAVFAHTQDSDMRFDDLFAQEDGDNIAAFLFEQVSDPALLVLRDPSDPGYQDLIDHPFSSVPVVTNAERKGRRIFRKYCMACHGTPQVFNDAAYVEPQGSGLRPTSLPAWAPAVGRGYDIGISEANVHGLRFTRQMDDGSFENIVLPLADDDGSIVEFVVDRDVGLAATTARYEDIGRFKSPALRNLSAHGPYFHDNSVSTIEGVVDYFCSDAYNDSKDGSLYPIHLNANKRADLVAFLMLL